MEGADIRSSRERWRKNKEDFHGRISKERAIGGRIKESASSIHQSPEANNSCTNHYKPSCSNKGVKTSKCNRTWYSKPEFNRKKRIAMYKMYSMEGKIKCYFKNGLRQFKRSCFKLVHGI
ncbi:hypothetical protein LIER_34076 [Lithospermum erythrorhizon]|uniref:Uncharacterized protein n=1 Tax=Lithospermum erythrorhizon TaxID=34254 RepID=A0AAV3S0C7_LITER